MSCVTFEQYILFPPIHTLLLLSPHRKPDLEPLLRSILELLSSPRDNDAISGELAELIGFDNIEISMGLLENRHEVAQQLSAYLQGGTQSAEPMRLNGLSKGKQREGTC